MNNWLLPTVCFIAGALTGALALGAVEHLTPATPGSTVSPLNGNPAGDTENEPAGVLPDGRSPRGITPIQRDSDNDRRWHAVDQAIARLTQRVSALEEQLAMRDTSMMQEDAPVSPNRASGGMDSTTLVAAGVASDQATEILRRQSELEMQRLELRDQASREGWLGTERFIDALRELEGDTINLRGEIGDNAYDRFLYLTGQPNRVVIDSVIDQSPASQAGIRAGDVLIDYANERIFSWSDLRNTTRAGERGEYVWVQLERNGEILELTLPRGPMGVRLSSDTVNPEDIDPGR